MTEHRYDFLGWKFSIALDEDHPLNDSPFDMIKEWAKDSKLLGDDMRLFSVERLQGVRIALNENGAVEEEQSRRIQITFLASTDPVTGRQNAMAWLDQYS